MSNTNRTLIIAEAGISHQGYLDDALGLVAAAKLGGADIVKFQSYDPSKILGKDSPYFDEASRAQLSQDDHVEVKKYCESIGIEYGLSIFHREQIEWTEKIGLRRYKIASRAARDKGLLQDIAGTRKPIIMSTGMLQPHEIRDALDLFIGEVPVTLMYCICDYPTPAEKIDFKEMRALSRFGVDIGFSCHCPSKYVPAAAVACGARAVEMHIKPQHYNGCDASSSLDIREFVESVEIIRQIERFL